MYMAVWLCYNKTKGRMRKTTEDLFSYQIILRNIFIILETKNEKSSRLLYTDFAKLLKFVEANGRGVKAVQA